MTSTRGIRKQPFAAAIVLFSLTVSFGRNAASQVNCRGRPLLGEPVRKRLRSEPIKHFFGSVHCFFRRWKNLIAAIDEIKRF
jgi:hypothetical protein